MVDAIQQYVDQKLIEFYQEQCQTLRELGFRQLLAQGPCLFAFNHINLAFKIVSELLDDAISLHEKNFLDTLLKELTIPVQGGDKANSEFAVDILETICRRSSEHDAAFLSEKNRALNRFTRLFIVQFCDDQGQIDWIKWIEFTHSNNENS